MRIGVAQIDTVPGAFSPTVERMVAQSQRAAEQGVELLVFPLAALAGVEPLPYADRGSFLRDVADAVAQLRARLACPAIVPVPVEVGDEGAFDALLVSGETVRSLRLAPQATDGAGTAAPGERDVPQFTFAGVRFALALSYAELDALDDYDYAVDAVLYVAGYPFALDDPSSGLGADLEAARFAADAQTTGAWLVGAGSLGGYGDQVFSGSSMVLAPSGALVALAPAFEEALLVADICGDDSPLADVVLPDVYDAPFALWQAVALGLRDYVEKCGYTDVALCIDGTLGSAVLVALASDAVGPLRVHALVGASAGSRAASCRELARRLRVDVSSAAPPLAGYDPRDVDELALGTWARELRALPLSSADKTQLALCPRSGALQAAALCPLGDVYRSDVLDMAHVRNTISPLFRRVALTEADALVLPLPAGGERLLASEADITGADEVLLNYVEYDRPLAEQLEGGMADRALVDAILRAERAAEPLRRALPPVLAMSTHTLDDARFPLGVPWHDARTDAAPYDYGFGASEPSQLRATEDEESPAPPLPAHMDLEGTLAMLRDLAEQGGFVPGELTPVGGEGGTAPADPAALAWMSPFSEN